MKINWKEDLRDIVGGIIIFPLLIILFGEFMIEKPLFFISVFMLFVFNHGIISFHERKYEHNFPYKQYKSKKNILERALLGLLAGLHYTFFIGTYNHKKYNTQVFYPETLECVFGNISQGAILIGYLFLFAKLFGIMGWYSLFLTIIPIITNLISLKK
mgnify:CR=1 FL=1